MLKKLLSKQTQNKEGRRQNMLIANAHRVPRKNKAGNQPDPIIVKFVQMKDREIVYNPRVNLTKGSKISVRTDLPIVLKKKRGERAQVAYRMRTKDKLKTSQKEETMSNYFSEINMIKMMIQMTTVRNMCFSFS